MHEVLVNRLGGLSLPRKSVVRLTDRPNMTLDVYRGCKTTIQQQESSFCERFTYGKSGESVNLRVLLQKHTLKDPSIVIVSSKQTG